LRQRNHRGNEWAPVWVQRRQTNPARLKQMRRVIGLRRALQSVKINPTHRLSDIALPASDPLQRTEFRMTGSRKSTVSAKFEL
jgi:hypothetical protein